MTDTDKTKEQLQDELTQARQEIAAYENERSHTEERLRRTNRMLEEKNRLLSAFNDREALLTQLRQEIVERTQMQEALQESEANLSRAQGIAQIGSWTWDITAGKIHWSDQMYRIYGLPLGTPPSIECVAALVHPEDRSSFEQAIAGVSHGKAPESVEYRIVKQDGEVRFVIARGEATFDTSDNLIQMVGTVQDITERRRAEEALQESERRSKAWIENSPVCIKILDLDFNLQFMSAAGIRELGIGDINEFYGKPYPFHFYPESFRVQMTSNLRKAKETGKTITQEAQVLGVHGDRLWYHSTIVPVNDDSGKSDYILVVSLETTKRRQAEETLQYRLELESLTASIATRFISPLPEGIDSVAQDALHLIGEFTGVDRSYVFMLSEDGSRMDNTHEWCAAGIEPQIQNLQGLSSAKFPWWMEQLQQNKCLHIPRVADMPPQASVEQTILQAQGIQSLIVFPIAYGGVLLGFLGFDSVRYEKRWQTEDMTLLRTIGEVLANAWVRQQAVAREHELQERAKEQQKLVAVGQLAAGIAHDFNNLLTGVLGHAEMMAIRPTLPQEFHSSVHIIQQQGRRAAQLIQQILDFSRKSMRQSSPVDLLPFLKEMLRLLQRTIPEHIDIHLDAIPGSYIVSADPTQLQQVFTNLAVNARDAMPEGGELDFHLSSLVLGSTDPRPLPDMPAGDSKWVVVTVSDTGTGISKEVLPHIYEPFFTTKSVGQGSGLGLSQVYGIVMQHDGLLDVESTLGEGTTFVLYLPAQEVRTESLSSGVQPDFPRGQGESVLVVEDDSAVLDVLKLALESLGYGVLTAQNGQEALDVYAQHEAVNDGTVPGDRPVWGTQSEPVQCSGSIDLVLTDIMMPTMGGVELCQKLRQHHGDVKVVLISGYPLGAGAVELLADGVVGWVQKPPSVETLAQVVRDAIERQ